MADFDCIRAYYSHLLKPSDLPFAYDVCFFKEGFQPLSGDQANVGGGKWTARLRKSVSSRVWEDLLLAMVRGGCSMSSYQIPFFCTSNARDITGWRRMGRALAPARGHDVSEGRRRHARRVVRSQ